MSDTTPDLHAICDSCLTAITDGEGHVWTDQHLADTVARHTRGQDTSRTDDETLTDALLTGQTGAAWHTTHNECAPTMPSWAYAIPVERINTWPAFLHWTAHLMDKPWFDGTDWTEVIHRAVNPAHAAVSGLRPIRPQDTDFRGVGS